MNLKIIILSLEDFTIFRFIKNDNVIDYDDDDDINLSRFKFRTDDNLLYNKKLMFLLV